MPLLAESACELKGAAGGGGGGPCPLEVEAAQVAGDVDDFADEEEAGDFAGLHGFAGEFVGVDATGGYFGFLKAFGARGADFPGVQFPFERFEGGVRPGLWRVVLQPAFGEALGQKFLKGFFGYGDGACARFADFLCGVAVRGEIDLDGFAFLPVAGGLENRGTAEAAMGEEHFFAKGFVLRRGYDLGGDTGEIGITLAVCGVEDERHEGGARRNNFQAELLRQVITKPGGAHFGDGEAAGGDDENGCAIFGGVAADDEGSVAGNLAHFGIHHDSHPGSAAFGFQHGGDQACGVIAEELPKRFFVIGDFVFFDEGDEIGGSVAREGGFGEVGILREEVFRLAMEIGEVAAAAPGDKDFFADFFGVFEEEDTAVTLAGFDGAEEAGGAGTEDDCIEVGQEAPFVDW